MADGLMTKYFGNADQHLYDFPFSGRSQEGFPVRGNPTMLRDEEYDRLSAQPAVEYHARWFRLWLPGDLAAYVEVMDHVENMLFYVKHRREVEVDRGGDDGKDLKVWLEWGQVFAMATPPAQAGPGLTSDQHANIPLGGRSDA